MLTALISLLSGLVTGAVPDLLKEWKDSRASTREREFLRLQHQLEMERLEKNADMKIREAETAYAVEEMKAFASQLATIVEQQAKPSGYKWIDGFNAIIRPAVSAGVMLLFFAVAFVYTGALISAFAKGAIDAATLASAVWGSMVGEGIQAVLGFLFGYKIKTRLSAK